MSNFWDPGVWGSVNLMAVLLLSLLLANLMKKKIKLFGRSLIPTSVLGGLLLLVVTNVYRAITGVSMFDTAFFGGNGTAKAEVITYHALALGFIASAFKPIGDKIRRERVRAVFNTGFTTVATYLLQGVLGLGITLLWAQFDSSKFPGAGILLPLGYGQGSGQALNWGGVYETDYGFVGGRSYGLSIAALGFLSAAIGGVICMHIAERRGRIHRHFTESAEVYEANDIQRKNEIPMNGSIDKLTVQIGFVFGAYLLAYLIMFGMGEIAGGLKSVFYGLNFLFGIIVATLINFGMAKLRRRKIVKKQYINAFLMKRISGFFFDLMIVAGIAAIRIEMISGYWVQILLLGLVGALATYFYNRFVAKKLFADYAEEQFLVMYGMLTGTASTGIILLREIDPEFQTPAEENLIYQNFPAIVFGFPMMILAALVPKQPLIALLSIFGLFIVLNLLLFRSFIFRRKKSGGQKA